MIHNLIDNTDNIEEFDTLNDLDYLKNYKIITLCGTTRLKQKFEKANMILTLNDKIILQPGCFMHKDKIEVSDIQKIKLDFLHKEKIMLSDCIYVITNKYIYIGDSTASEIEFAIANNKPVFYSNLHED